MPDQITILNFLEQPELLSKYFIQLNHEWLNKYYFVTEEDDKLLSDPERIIQDGGCILFAKFHNEIVGTCALIKINNREYEIAKMGVSEKAQGKGAGNALLQ